MTRLLRYEDIQYPSADGRLQLYARDYSHRGVEAVLCLHGLTRNSADFAGLAGHLSAHFRVIAADQRGRGRSEWDTDKTQYNLGVYVADMFALLDHLELEKVSLIGTSMGGLMSMLMAVTAPERFSRIVLNDVGPELATAGLERIRSYVGKGEPVTDWAGAAEASRLVNADAFPDYGLEDWLAFARRTFHEVDGRPVPAYDPAIAEGMAPQSEAVVPADLWPVWEKLSGIPILAIRGGLSDLLSAETLERMEASHPRLKTLTLARRGHAPMLDEPEAVAAIDAFLREPA